MKTFFIYKKQNSSTDRITNIHEESDYVFLQDKISWSAMFLNIFFLLYNRLWILSILFLAIIGIAKLFLPAYATIITISCLIWLGFEGNDLIGKRLEKSNYRLYGVIVSPNKIFAKKDFYQQEFGENF